MSEYELPQLYTAPRAKKSQVLLVANGDLRESANRACWPAQAALEDGVARAREILRYYLDGKEDAFRDAETCDFADVLLPAATWAEKEGTVTNSERRISRVRAAIAPPGEARADWQIAVDFARRLSPAGAKLFPYQNPEQIFNEHRESTRGRDLDITGMSYALLDAAPQQWPMAVPSAMPVQPSSGSGPTPRQRA